MPSTDTLDIAYDLVERELNCYENNLARGCYDDDFSRYCEVVAQIQSLKCALEELESL